MIWYGYFDWSKITWLLKKTQESRKNNKVEKKKKKKKEEEKWSCIEEVSSF
jgi:hypothetical protein